MAKGLTPRSLWRHFPPEEFDTERFSETLVDFQLAHQFDLVKVTPRSSFCVRDYGCEDIFRGNPLGIPEYVDSVVRRTGWRALRPLDPDRGFLRQQLDCLERIGSQLGRRTPIFQTVFAPLIQARNLCPPTHARWEPDLYRGLEVLAESTRRFVEKMSPLVDGIFYVVGEDLGLAHLAQSDFVRDMDKAILEVFPGTRMLHVHGTASNLPHFSRYPVSILHWDEVRSGFPLERGKEIFGGTVSGGIDWPTDGWPSQDALLAHCRRTCERVGSERFLLAPSCVVPFETPAEMIRAFRHADC